MSLFEDQDSRLQAGLREFVAQADSATFGTPPDDPGRWWRALADFGSFAGGTIESASAAKLLCGRAGGNFDSAEEHALDLGSEAVA